MMKVSLITVSYNSEETIRETFESVRKQIIEGFELEYIHVDGFSNDGTINISKEFDDIITYRISEKDSGIYNAMNKGIKIATGDVIGFLNSDDTFYNNDILFLIAQQFSNTPSLDIVYGDINYVDHKGKVKRKWRTGERKSFRTGWHPAHPGFYASKRLFNKYGGFDEDFRIAADFDLMLRFIEVEQLKSKYITKVFVSMKLGGESNRDFKNILKGSQDIKNSFSKYNITYNRLYILLRWARKMGQRIRA